MKKTGKILGIIGSVVVLLLGVVMAITPYSFNMTYGSYSSESATFGGDFYTDIYKAVDNGMENIEWSLKGLGNTVVFACGLIIFALGTIALLYFIAKPVVNYTSPATNSSAPVNNYLSQLEHNQEEFSGNVNEIKTYKELLDQGAITQEQFEQKKKELLGFGENNV